MKQQLDAKGGTIALTETNRQAVCSWDSHAIPANSPFVKFSNPRGQSCALICLNCLQPFQAALSSACPEDAGTRLDTGGLHPFKYKRIGDMGLGVSCLACGDAITSDAVATVEIGQIGDTNIAVHDSCRTELVEALEAVWDAPATLLPDAL